MQFKARLSGYICRCQKYQYHFKFLRVAEDFLGSIFRHLTVQRIIKKHNYALHKNGVFLSTLIYTADSHDI